MKEIGIVICNFNKKDFLKDCIDSVLKNNIAKSQYDIIVVDNASTDGAPEMVKQQFSNEVILLENQENLGGSGGFSRGMDFCLNNNYEYIVLLDNDTRIEADTIEKLKNHIDQNPEVGIVGAKILQMQHPEILQELGAYIDWDNYSIKTPYKGYKNSDKLPDMVECDYVAACCLITRRDVLKQAGTFDVRHFIYWDDMDWCTRVKKLGYKIRAISNATVHHKMGAKNTVNTFNSYYFSKNRLLFFIKHLPKDKIENFCHSISDDYLKLSFFSSLKFQYKNVLSQLWAIDDLNMGNYGRVENHIFERENNSLFKERGIGESSTILLSLNNNVEESMNVYLSLKEYVSDIFILDKHKIFNQFKDLKIVSLEDIENLLYDYSFVVVDHIINESADKIKFKNQITIDKYLNIEFTKNIEFLRSSYEFYQNMYQNIYSPMLIEKIHSTYENMHNNSTDNL